MPQKFLSVRESDYQRIVTKRPDAPWIKLHRALYRDPVFVGLSTHHRFLYTGLLQLAYDTANRIYNDSTYLGQMLYVPHTQIDLKPLYRSGLLVTSNLSRTLSETETETESRADSEPAVTKARARGKTTFPDDWKLTDEEKDGWLRHGLNASVEFASFRDHALSNDRRCADWPAAFRNWCRKSLAFKDQKRVS